MKLLQFDLTEGLKSERSVVKMLPTFVSSNKTTMKSQTITLDLGGTGFRVYLIDSNGEIIHETIVKIPENIKRGTENLMSFIANSLKKFFIKYKLPLNNKMPLGFTFSYPCVHNGLTSASLMRWTKGFSADGFKDKNIVQMLREACSLEQIQLGVITLINDTVGTLLACSLVNGDCSVGLVVATGFNIAYMENVKSVPKLKNHDKLKDYKEICINTEMGAFGENETIEPYRTDFDRLLDTNSINPKEQIFEKMISAMYLGELMRLVVRDLFEAGMIFNGKPNAISLLEGQDFFKTSNMTKIAEYNRRYEKRLTKIQSLITVDISPTFTDCAVLSHVSSLIFSRSEMLTAVASVGEQINTQQIIIGVDFFD
ncbi:unnamed protein product [Meloidogyne enterolobii]